MASELAGTVPSGSTVRTERPISASDRTRHVQSGPPLRRQRPEATAAGRIEDADESRTAEKTDAVKT